MDVRSAPNDADPRRIDRGMAAGAGSESPIVERACTGEGTRAGAY